MSVLDNMVTTAVAYRRAGNLARAEEIASKVLGQDIGNLGAYDCLFHVLLDKKDFMGANRLSKWRLSQHPNCVQTNMNFLLLLGATLHQDKAANQIAYIRANLGDSPLFVQEAEIIYSHYFSKPGNTLSLIEKARLSGELSSDWLDYFERLTREQAGHIFARRRFLEADLTEEPNDAQTIMELADIHFLTARPFNAIRAAKRGKILMPSRANRFKLVQIFSYLSLCPLIWGAQFCILFKVTVIDRAGLLLLLPLLCLGLILGAFLELVIISPARLLGPETYNTVKNICLIANIIWGLALIFAFDLMDSNFSDEEKSIKLSKDY